MGGLLGKVCLFHQKCGNSKDESDCNKNTGNKICGWENNKCIHKLGCNELKATKKECDKGFRKNNNKIEQVSCKLYTNKKDNKTICVVAKNQK